MTQVAVYGTLKQGEGNHRLLEHLTPLGTDTIQGWDMFSVYGGSFPFIVKGEGSIVVEVYELEDQRDMDNLDGLEGYPSFYDRVQVETRFGEAWIYFWPTATKEERTNLSNIFTDSDGAKYFSDTY